MIDYYTPLASAEGALIETDATFTESKIARGLLKGRLPVHTFNRIANRADTLANEIARNGVRTRSDADAELALIKNFHGSPFGKSRDAANIFDISNNPVYDLQYCNHATLGRILIAPHYLSIKAFDIEAETDLGDIVTQAQLVAGFTGITTPYPISICCDAEYIYVLCRQSATATPQAQAFSIADGSVHPDWPAGGVAMSTYAAAYSNYWEARIRWVAEGKLGVSQPWVTVTLASHHAIRVLDSATGAVLGSGAGDFAGTSGRCVGICGNGTDAFFVIQETGQASICSMDLVAYGATGSGGVDFPVLNTNWDNNEFGGILCAGQTVVATFIDSAQAILHIHDVERGAIFSLSSSDTALVATLGVIAFTGLAWWALGTGDCGQALFRLDAVDRYANASPTYTTSADKHVTRFGDYRARNYDVTDVRMAPLVYDGRDLWYLQGDSTASAYNLRRLPRVNVR
jgi:hypothetical protein